VGRLLGGQAGWGREGRVKKRGRFYGGEKKKSFPGLVWKHYAMEERL